MFLIRHRLPLQLLLLAVAIAVVVHGLTGPQIAPRNLATVLTWVHYRGLLVVALLAVGNLFCTACPLILARDTARRAWHPALTWPRWLRGKWLALVLTVGVLVAYEVFDLWALPRATAWLVLGYFAAALIVDVAFKGAAFCKYVCPVGQFSFLASTLSPTELRAKDLHTCRRCATVDCIRGTTDRDPSLGTLLLRAGGAGRGLPARRAGAAPVANAVGAEDGRGNPATGPASTDAPAGFTAVAPGTSRSPDTGTVRPKRGCELALFMPNKVGNLDCTLCGDCVRACPHDNIALTARVPGLELLDTRRRSGIGRLARRPDMAALIVVFTFGALLNAAAMTVAPAALLLALVGLACALGLLFTSRTALAYAAALVPLGLGMWAAHYAFHFLTGVLTAVPVTQAAAIDLFGRAALGEPAWRLVGVQPGAVFPVQIGLTLLGAAGSIGLAHATASRENPARPLVAAAPWVVLVGLLAAAAIWVLNLPMDMRGVGLTG